ncbi:hypothetical protein PanWU01x14_368520 [Parasponia andersonii]|uniref:Uncharacterized protein n=1 Tax=Parasponia andersonii TaxID=3476 RepID=A0A2P5A4Z7_PARAD|nr:hypothetical protein PanWU01x14_368520 [Parasponia andersonii]
MQLKTIKSNVIIFFSCESRFRRRCFEIHLLSLRFHFTSQYLPENRLLD